MPDMLPNLNQDAQTRGQPQAQPSRLVEILKQILPMAAAAGLGAVAGGGRGSYSGAGQGALQALGGYGQQQNVNTQVGLQKQQLEQQRSQQETARVLSAIRAMQDAEENKRKTEEYEYGKTQRPREEAARDAMTAERLRVPERNIDPNSPEGIAAALAKQQPNQPNLAEQQDADILAAYAAENKIPVGQLTPEQKVKARANAKKMMDINGEPLYPVVVGDNVVYMKRSEAAGQAAPRTIFNEQGLPSVAGKPGVSTVPPPLIAASTSEQLGNLATVREMFSDVEPLLTGVLGPATGRVKLAEVNKLGGLGASPAEIDLANKLQRLVTTQAFQNGGKQLTETEYAQFKKLSPGLDDTIAQAAIKTKNAIAFLDLTLRNRIKYMSPRQRAQLPDETEKAPASKATLTPKVEEYLKKNKLK